MAWLLQQVSESHVVLLPLHCLIGPLLSVGSAHVKVSQRANSAELARSVRHRPEAQNLQPEPPSTS